jgi:hypothetical protein
MILIWIINPQTPIEDDQVLSRLSRMDLIKYGGRLNPRNLHLII